MVRRHGWQLPAHAFQVVAITVFLLLMLAFYIFLSPFLGSSSLEYVSLAVYSPVALAVFLLYFRSTAIDPSDPGVLEKQRPNNFEKNLVDSGASLNRNESEFKSPLGLFTPARSSSVAHSDKDFEYKTAWVEEGRQRVGLCGMELGGKSKAHGLGGVLCGWLVQDDNCRDDGLQQQPSAEEEALFCTLCNVEVRKLSKHCRNCDKCVDGFDHHCRWLNNCVGRKNYVTFVVLMASSLLLLVFNWGTGIAVLVRCFISKPSVEEKIFDRLGSGFSRTPFAAVVALCTLVALLASIPLGELFFFHLILMKKGITTYEYVMAMRAQSEGQGAPDNDEQSAPTSPSSSTATGLSAASSLGLHYRGVWCTPPRVFVENQDEVVPHLAPNRVPSTVDPDVDNNPSKSNSKSQKNAVRISAWKLAKLDPNEATRAGAKARQSSSVLRPLKIQNSSRGGTDYTSTMSSRSSVSTETGHSGRNAEEVAQNSPQVPVGRVVGTRTHSSCSTPSRVSVNESGGMSPSTLGSSMPLHSTSADPPPARTPLSVGLPSAFSHAPPNQHLPSSTFDHPNRLHHLGRASVYEEYTGRSVLSQMNRNLRESKRTAVFWSDGAGRLGSSVAKSSFTSSEENLPSSGPIFREPRLHVNPGHRVHSSSSNVSGEGLGLPENLLYSGASIFFGGPMCTPSSLQRNKPPSSDVLGVDAHRAGSSRMQNRPNRPSQGSTLQYPHSPVFPPSS